jgi:hypothetical protein
MQHAWRPIATSTGKKTPLQLTLCSSIATPSLSKDHPMRLAVENLEGSGYGFRTVRVITPSQAEMPHACKMMRPA